MSSELFPAGTVIDGRYRIVRPLGQGGFARVFEAEHLQLERRAALKILNYVAEPGDTFYQRFVREAKIAANLDHPNVVTIFDFGVVEGRNLPYIAMEALDGRDLYEELKDHGPMTPARAIPLFLAALEALGEGHSRGIVHKDLKPSNLFLVKPGTAQERLVVVDYGIARLNDDPNGQLTRTGAMSGTPAYLAPEYFQDQSVTPALDVYQMGLIIAETLTGKRVVDAATPVAIAVAHTSGQHDISPRLLESPLGPFLRKSLMVEPTERFRDAEEMRRALEQIPLPGPEVSFATVDASAQKSHTPEAFAATAQTPSSDFQPSGGWSQGTGQTAPGRPGSDKTGSPQPGQVPGSWDSSGPSPTPSAPLMARPDRGMTQPQPKKNRALMWAIVAFSVLTLSGFALMLVVVAVVVEDDSDFDAMNEGAVTLTDTVQAPEINVAPPGDLNLAPGTSKLNQKLYGYAMAQASLYTLTYMMHFYETSRVNFGGLDNPESVMLPPDLGSLYGSAETQLRRSLKIRPARGKVDSAAKAFNDQLQAFKPIIEDAHMYYQVNRGFESDGGKGGKALDKRIMKAWPAFRAAEAKFADLMYANWIAYQKDLAAKYNRTGTEPTRAKAAEVIGRGALVMREARKDPRSAAYKKAVDRYRLAYDDYRKHLSSQGAKLDGKFGPISPHTMLKSPAQSLLEEAQQYPKQLDENEATAKSNQHIKMAMPAPGIQHMTQAFHQMVSMQNHLLAN